MFGWKETVLHYTHILVTTFNNRRIQPWSQNSSRYVDHIFNPHP